MNMLEYSFGLVLIQKFNTVFCRDLLNFAFNFQNSASPFKPLVSCLSISSQATSFWSLFNVSMTSNTGKKTVNVSFTLISLSPRRIPAQSAGVPLLTYATSTHVALSFQPPTIVQYQDIFEDKFKVIFHSFTREIVKGIVFCMSNVFVG